MSDLSSLMQIAPGTAAYMMGQNQAQTRDTEALRQQELQAIIAGKIQEQQQAGQMNPLLLDNKRLTNQGLQYGLPGIQADSDKKQVEATLAQVNYPGNAAATDAKNRGIVRDEGLKDVDGINQFFISASDTLGKMPPALRMGALVEQMKMSKIDPQSPMAQEMLQKLSKMDANVLPKYFSDLANSVGKKKALQTPGYHQAIDVANISAAERRYATDKHAETSKYTADQNLAGKQAAIAAKAKSGEDILARVKSGQVTPEKAAAQFEVLSVLADTQEERDKYAGLARTMETFVMNKPVGGKVGDPTYNPETGLGNKQLPPAAMGNAGKPKPGTKENPIKLD